MISSEHLKLVSIRPDYVGHSEDAMCFSAFRMNDLFIVILDKGVTLIFNSLVIDFKFYFNSYLRSPHIV